MNEPLDQLNPVPTRKNPIGKIVIGNFAVMLLYMVGSGLVSGRNSGGFDALLLACQAGLNLLMGLGTVFSKASRLVGVAFLLSGLLVAVIGPGICSYKYSLLSRTEVTTPKPN